jgi:hypothetical protein
MITGAGGDDVLVGNGGHDTLRGWSGDDRVYAKDGVADTVDCGDGTGDRLQADGTDSRTGCEGTAP